MTLRPGRRRRETSPSRASAGSGERVLVVGMGTVAELATLRGLRAAGFEPWLVTWDPHSPAAHSRAACGVVAAPSPADAAGLAEAIAGCLRRDERTAVLAGVEAAMIALAEAAGALGDGAVPSCSDPATVALATSKRDLSETAARVGIETPPTTWVGDDGLGDAAISYPAVVKPVRSVHRGADGELQRTGVRRVADAGELRAALAQAPADALVQPYIDAPIRTLNGVAWEGELVAPVHQVAERIWPPDCGVLSASRTVEPDAGLEQQASRLLAELGWSGIFNLQFLDREGTPILMDLNPRPYQSLALAIAAGVNLPAIWVDLVLGRPPRVGACRPGVRWRYIRDDLLALAAAARSGSWRAALRGLVPRPGTVDAVVSLRDPLPTVAVIRRDLRRLGGRSRP